MNYEETIATIKANFRQHFWKKPNWYGIKGTLHLTFYSAFMAFWYGIRGRYPSAWKDQRYSLANDNLYKIIFCEAFARLLLKYY